MKATALNRKNVKHNVESRSIGNYWLGKFLDNGIFLADYVGRSDTCLQSRLLDHVGGGDEAFIARSTESVKEAYEIECREWHMVSMDLRNEVHPRAPRHLPYTCPYCEYPRGEE